MGSSGLLSKAFNRKLEISPTSHFLSNIDLDESQYYAVDRPGYFGDKREDIFKKYDAHYGKDNWKIGWIWNGEVIPFDLVCGLYEISYYEDSKNKEDLWKQLMSGASDVYDDNESNVNSKYNYLLQETNATHIQDIAIRRVARLRGFTFCGEKLMQVRGTSNDIGKYFTPNRVPFYMPEAIIDPIKGWWNNGSVEEMYQSAKVVVVTPEVLEEILREPDSLICQNYLKVAHLVDDSRVA